MNLGMPCLQVGKHPTCDLKELGDTLPTWLCLPCLPAQPTAQVLISVGHEWTAGHLPWALCLAPTPTWVCLPRGPGKRNVLPSVGRTKFCLPDTNPTAATPGWRHPRGSSGSHLLPRPLCSPIPGHAGCLNLWGFALSVFHCPFSGLFPGRAAGAGCGRSAGEEAGSSSFPSI